jgi:methionine biosynthesis protein MetW
MSSPGLGPVILVTAAKQMGSRLHWQDEVIASEIPLGASVLDLGCGDGQLLSQLIRTRGARGQGIELDPDAVVKCIERLVPVLQADLDAGLAGFPDGSFDYVVLEETIQTLQHPIRVLDEMLRVGRFGIVSFPNFGHRNVIRDLSERGRMPVTDWLPHRWHNSPNIHLCTLQDFVDWTEESRVQILKGFVLTDGLVRPLQPGDNRQSEQVLLFLART